MECQIIEGGCGDFIMVGGRGKPSLTCETRIGPDGQPYYEKGGKPVTTQLRPVQLVGPRPDGRTSSASAAARDVEKPAGEWNRMEVICDGDTITNIVNGYVVNVGTKSSLTKGKIHVPVRRGRDPLPQDRGPAADERSRIRSVSRRDAKMTTQRRKEIRDAAEIHVAQPDQVADE